MKAINLCFHLLAVLVLVWRRWLHSASVSLYINHIISQL